MAYLVENIGCRFTATKMLKPLGVSSASTVTQWCDWIEKAYLFFIVRERHAVTAAVQACTVVTDENRDREIGGLLKALGAYALSQGTIVTLKQRDQLVVDGKTVRLVPFSDWSRE